MLRAQLGLATRADKALQWQVIGGGLVEAGWRRRSHRQSHRQLAEKAAGAGEKAAGGGNSPAISTVHAPRPAAPCMLGPAG